MANDTCISLIWNFGSKGSLRCILDSNEVHIDSAIRLSFCFDVLSVGTNVIILIRVLTRNLKLLFLIFQGITYIHSSKILYHGSLSSLICTLDQRLSIRLVASGSRKTFRDHISNRLNCAPSFGDKTAVTNVLDLWQPPEILLDSSFSGSKAADIFSIAVIFGEIWTGDFPLGIQINYPKTVQSESTELSR